MDVKGVIATLGGTILLYSAIKNYRPQDVVKWALGGPRPKTASAPGTFVNTLPKSPSAGGSLGATAQSAGGGAGGGGGGTW